MHCLASLWDAGHFSIDPVVVFSGASKTTTGYPLTSLQDALLSRLCSGGYSSKRRGMTTGYLLPTLRVGECCPLIPNRTLREKSWSNRYITSRSILISYVFDYLKWLRRVYWYCPQWCPQGVPSTGDWWKMRLQVTFTCVDGGPWRGCSKVLNFKCVGEAGFKTPAFLFLRVKHPIAQPSLPMEKWGVPL